jgi:hypothetical protein
MNRRTVLRRTGALAALGLAGCLSDGSGDTPTDTEPPMPEIDSTTIDTTGTDCASGDGGVATLEADAGGHRLTVTGTIEASNPCHVAELVETDLSDGTITVTVGTEPDGSDACMECIGAVDYEATVQLTPGLEADVVVSHETFDGVSEVARETVSL